MVGPFLLKKFVMYFPYACITFFWIWWVHKVGGGHAGFSCFGGFVVLEEGMHRVSLVLVGLQCWRRACIRFSSFGGFGS